MGTGLLHGCSYVLEFVARTFYVFFTKVIIERGERAGSIAKLSTFVMSRILVIVMRSIRFVVTPYCHIRMWLSSIDLGHGSSAAT